MNTSISSELSSGQRFEFGRNWSEFLGVLSDDRIAEAERSLRSLLGADIAGKRFLDIGCGSGLFSLAARRAGARVVSFDYDPLSAGCAERLRSQYDPSGEWDIGVGSVLDRGFMESLGTFDIVYSWGVLHHTGDLQTALSNAASAVAPTGTLAIAIYNDQGWRSEAWKAVKRAYNTGAKFRRAVIVAGAFTVLWGPSAARDLSRLRVPLSAWRNYASTRGMSAWHDLIDWVGGYPFEVASPKNLVARVEPLGFSLEKLNYVGGIGCNEFVFKRRSSVDK